MGYRILRQSTDCVAVPPLVIQKLPTARGEDIKVALCLLAQGCADAGAVAAQLGISRQSVEMSFAFWVGAGLLEADGEITGRLPDLPKREPRLSTREVVERSKADPNIAMLVTESQSILGRPLSPSESAALVTLYVQDMLPIDMILTVMAHFAARGKREVRYLEKVLLSWREEGICNGVDAERYLAVLERREVCEKEAAELLGLPAGGFTAGERTLIARWYEDYGYDREMISAALVLAGEKRGVRYISGILKKWHAKGYHTPQQLPADGTNLQPAGRHGTAAAGSTRSSSRYKSGMLVSPGSKEGSV